MVAEDWFDEFERFGEFPGGPAPAEPTDTRAPSPGTPASASGAAEPTGAPASADPADASAGGGPTGTPGLGGSEAARASLTVLDRVLSRLEHPGVAQELGEAEALAMTRLATRLMRLAATAELAGGAGSVLRELPGEVEGLRRATDAVGARALPALEANGMWALDGQRSFTSWLVAKSGNTRGRCDREIRRARALRDYLPTFAGLLADGELGADHVDAVVREAMGTQDRLLALRDPEVGEHVLAGAAADATANEFTRTLRLWAVRMDPDAADRQWRESLASEHCTLSATLGGYHLEAFLSSEHGQLLRIAMDAQIGQVGAEDERTRAQRDAHALTSLAKQSLDSGLVQRDARIRPHLIAIVPVETWTRTATAGLLAGRVAATAALEDTGEEPEAVITAALDARQLLGVVPATFEDGTPLSPSQLALHMCDSAVTRVVLDAESEVIDVGREKRLFTESQAKGILARDRHCQYPGCDARPNWCQYHHTTWWSRDGESNIAEGILLCWAHHQQVHALGLSILRYPDRWEYRTPDGRIHATRQRHHHPTLPIPRTRQRT